MELIRKVYKYTEWIQNEYKIVQNSIFLKYTENT
jgi:hypothetical protein